MNLYKTRFLYLRFGKVEPGCWSFFDCTDGHDVFGPPGKHAAKIGPHYARKDELLADLTRFATERGFTDALT